MLDVWTKLYKLEKTTPHFGSADKYEPWTLSIGQLVGKNKLDCHNLVGVANMPVYMIIARQLYKHLVELAQ